MLEGKVLDGLSHVAAYQSLVVASLPEGAYQAPFPVLDPGGEPLAGVPAAASLTVQPGYETGSTGRG